MNILQKIVTPGFIAFNAHCWAAYALVFTFHHWWVVAAVIVSAGIKEFYIDKHDEVAQSFRDNLTDFAGYMTGVVAALAMLRVMS
jgi:hypothetical protein